jgi:tetratricopeptide (TPR) repeat protein
MARKRRSIYTWGWAAAVVVSALVLTWAAWPRNVRPDQELLPDPVDRPHILISDFEDRSEGRHTGNAPEEDIYQALLDRVRADGQDLHVARLNKVADEFSAAYLGQSNNATWVVWGWTDGANVYPHIERIEAPTGGLSTLPFCALDDPPTQVPHLASFVLAVHAHNQERYAQALEYLDAAAAEDLGCGIVHNQQGLAHQALGNHDAALAAFSRAIAMEPETAGFYANRGATFATIEQYHAAHADFARAWELTRDLATLFN